MQDFPKADFIRNQTVERGGKVSKTQPFPPYKERFVGRVVGREWSSASAGALANAEDLRADSEIHAFLHHLPSKDSRRSVLHFAGFLLAASLYLIPNVQAQKAYYLNDLSTNGNFYTTAPGSDLNSGTNAASPMRTLTNLLATHTLEPGDTVYIDTGTYGGHEVNISVAGASGNPITFQGAPEQGATVFDRGASNQDMFYVSNGSYLRFRNLTVQNARHGFTGPGANSSLTGNNGLFENMLIFNTQRGIRVGGSNWLIRNSIFHENGIGITSHGATAVVHINRCVFSNNSSAGFGIVTENASTVYSSAFTGGGYAFVGGSAINEPIIPHGDYNVFWATLYTLPGLVTHLSEMNMPNSVYADPQFADMDSMNFYPKSVTGRYDLSLGNTVTDSVHSVLIDFGDPASTAWTNEPDPNGGRLNAGAFGGTEFASMSRTNPWLYAVTFGDGGGITGGVKNLVWNYGAFDSEDTVAIQYRADGAGTWEDIATEVPVTNRVQSWDVTGLSPMAVYWRVVCEDDATVYSKSGQRFSVNGAKVPYYVNDGSTDGNVYTTEVGSDANDGVTPATPMASLTNLFATYNFGGHDIVYIDTGVYSNYTVEVGLRQAGSVASGRFTLRGSTNLAGGSVFDRNNLGEYALHVTGDRVNVEHLTFKRGLRIDIAANNVALRDVRVFGMAAPGTAGSINISTSEGVTFERCIVKGGGVGIRGSSAFSANGNVMWGNSAAFNLSQVAATNSTISNTVIAGGNVFESYEPARLAKGDYNILWDASIGPAGYPDLNTLQKGLDSWWHSATLDPRFHDPANSNFFPRSIAGRYDPDMDDFVPDFAHSPLIDFGDPASMAWTNETLPNGDRLNAGAFGGTPWASRSRSTPWLQVLTYNVGGILNVEENDRVYWTGGNLPPEATVRIELAAEPGADWRVATNGILASEGSWAWNYAEQTSTTQAMWRVVYEGDTNVWSQTASTFAFRNGPFVYYVNNDSTDGNVYTVAPGDNANLGLDPSTPKATLQAVLNAYAMEPGDVIYVDTGVYTLGNHQNNNPVMGITHSGSTNQFVYVVGSTNYAAGGTVFRRTGTPAAGTYGLDVSEAEYVQVSDIRFENHRVGLRLNNATGSRVLGAHAYSNRTHGILVTGSPGAELDRVVSYNNVEDGIRVTSGDATVLHSVLWRNTQAGLRVTGGTAYMTNSVIVASGVSAFGYHAAATSSVVANYNNIHAENDAVVGRIVALGRNQVTLSAWSAETGQDTMSLSVDPLFFNAPTDFHLKTQVTGGRYNPMTGSWGNDPVTSPLIAAGDPSSDFSEEPLPNGGRVNIGLYGNTPEASKCPPEPLLYVASLRQGGWVRDTAALHWVARNLDGEDLVRVEFSPDGGKHWSELHAGIPATNEVYHWDTTSANDTVAGLWRVSLAADSSLMSQTTNFFSIRNAGAMAWYVNNEDMTDNVWATAPGAATNWVATTNRPLNALATVFARYNVEPGDTVYVDTGTYPAQPGVVIRRRAGGTAANPVVVLGSTHCSVDGSQLEFEGGTGLDLVDTSYVQISNIVVRGATTGARVLRSTHIGLTGFRALESTGNGLQLTGSSNVDVRRSVLAHNTGFGLTGSQSGQVRVQQSVVWSNTAGAINLSDVSGASVSNSVLTASGVTNRLYTLSDVTQFRSDYNNLRLENSAEVALFNNVLQRFLTSWQGATTNDVRSLTHDPLFVDPASGLFYPQSERGRYDPDTCDFVLDGVTSPLIDAAHPSEPFGQETAPNGGRMNIGLYGNHPRASRTPEEGRLIAVSLYSGGVIRGTNNLYWFATGAATGHSVRVEFMATGDTNWTVLASNVAANAGTFQDWDTEEIGSLPATWWRVVSENDADIIGSNAVPFMINNGAITYYINDSSTNGNVYTKNPGHEMNDGLDPTTPLPSLAVLIDRYQIQPGDIIYMDTGEYVFDAAVTFDALMSGTGTDPIQIIGSTNYAAGGTVINRLKGGPVFQFFDVESYSMSHLRFTNTVRAIRLLRSHSTVFSNIEIAFPEDMRPAGDRYGFWLDRSTNIVMNRVAIHGLTNAARSWAIQAEESEGLLLENGVLWSNRVGINLAGGSSITVSNTVIAAFGVGRVGIQAAFGSSWTGDYNNIYARNGAYPVQDAIRLASSGDNPENITITASRPYRDVASWHGTTSSGAHTLSRDPLFADAGAGNFYLSSQAGRFDPATGIHTNDTITSPLIDAGNPAAAFTNEPDPNGGRINIGLYGNTEWASKTPEEGALTVLSFNDGGVAQGDDVKLRWMARGAVTGETVRIRFSDDGGATWSDLATDIPATNHVYTWDSTESPSTLFARWRVEREPTAGTVFGENEVLFAVRNTNFVFYVNDDSTDGDVYTTAIGDATNTGLSPDSPLPGLADVFTRYNVEAGDTIYVDTGTYDLTGNLVIRQIDAGLPGNPVHIIGSTNRVDGGTVFTGGGIRFDETLGLTMKNIKFNQAGVFGGTSVHVLRATNTFMQAVDVHGGGTAFHIERSTDTRMLHCSARNVVTNGLWNEDSLGVVWEQGLLWSNRFAVRGLSGTTVSNSVLGAFGPQSYIYLGRRGTLRSDYNSFSVHQGAWIASGFVGSDLPILYPRLGNWAQASGQDRHSLIHDPLFANAAAGDFHLKSQAPQGRYLPNGARVQDAQTSPLIDAGGPGAPFDAEPMPNGGRVNIGRFGNTFEASLTPTNAALHAVSLYDGGTVRGTNVSFNWVAQGEVTGHLVRVWFSPDNGATWSNLAENISASDGSFTWDIDPEMPSTVLARWRLESQTDTNLVAQPPVVFAIRNLPVLFYVNNDATDGNVYTTAVGDPNNTGTTPEDPKDSVLDILRTYDTEPGDVIYVDTGEYTINQTIAFTTLDKGSISNNIPLTVMGSTNYAAGGTVFNVAGASPAISLTDSEYVSLQHLTIRSAGVGISIQNSPGYDFRFLRIEGGATGVTASGGSHDGRFRHCLIRDVYGTALSLSSVSRTRWEHGVMWSNAISTNVSASISVSGGSASFSNSVFSQFGDNAVFSWNSLADVQSDYNFFHMNDASYVARRSYPSDPDDPNYTPLPMIARNLYQWGYYYGQDQNSLIGDPLFANPVSGDFHPLSEAGRYIHGEGWTNDTQTSLLIDSGNPLADHALEPAPHGNRVNIGLYGNTPEASRSPSEPRLVTVTLRKGGGSAAGDAFRLRWRAYGTATGDTIRVDFSPDDGESWEEVITNVAANLESGILWDTTPHPSTWRGVWRVTTGSDTNVYGQTEDWFALRNEPLALYINDASTNDTVYTTARGRVDNDGTSPATPRLSLQSVLDDYHLEPGDVIYMDTGHYIIGETITWTRFSAWSDMRNLEPLRAGGVSVTLQGSTHDAAGGTRITRVGDGTALELVNAYGVRVRNVRFNNNPAGTGRAIRLTRSPYVVLDWIRSRNASVGVDVNRSHDVRINHTLIAESSQYGLLSMQSSNTVFRHGVLWSNTVGARVEGPGVPDVGSLTVENSVLGMLRPETAGLEREDLSNRRGTLVSDYNVFHVVTGAYVGRLTGPYPGRELPLLRLVRWNERTEQDLNSVVADPLFADPANGDFHPKSPYGRYVTGSGYITNAMEAFSPLIDGARPSASYDLEPDPNGWRANIGLYGNTDQASKSPTNGVLRVLTFNDGGSGFSNIWLRWTASGPVAGHSVTLQFSPDGGGTWTNIVENYPAHYEEYEWDATEYGRAVAGLWRIWSQEDPSSFNVTNATRFRLRGDGSVPYYVNVPTSNGDIYTTVPGHDSNTGWLPSEPKATLQSLLDDNELEPGDVVYIDTGVYTRNANTTVRIFDAGVSNNPVIIRGSTNWVAGGAVMNRVSGGTALHLFETQGIQVENITFRNAATGVLVTDSEWITLKNITATDNSSHGVRLSDGRNVRLENSLLTDNDSTGISLGSGSQLGVNHVVAWGNPVVANIGQGAALQISNSVLRTTGTEGRIYMLGQGVTNVISDYNNIIREERAVLAERSVQFGGNEFYPRTLDWQRFLGQDTHSLSHDPLFADTGGGDFHPKSVEGRWAMTNWVVDADHSPLIDTGSPFSAYDREEEPNGGRVNIGRYGNTPEASLSRTNAWLLAVSLKDGGMVYGTQRLYWVAGNMDPSDTVRVEYASDGLNWIELETDIPVYTGEYMWDASKEPITQFARWRVVSEVDPDVSGEVGPFIVKNEIIVAYVNDLNTEHTVFTTAAGNPENTGLAPHSPMDNPAAIVERYPFGPGDVLYIDTGEYYIARSNYLHGIRFGLIGDTLKSGFPGFPITVLGSTNYAAGGSRLIGTGNPEALLTLNAAHDIHVHDLSFSNATRGVRVVNSGDIELHNLRATRCSRGFEFSNARDATVTRAASYNNTWGFEVAGNDSRVDIQSSVAVSNSSAAINLGANASLDINNSILDVSNPNALAYRVHGQGAIRGDYNMIWPGTNTVFAQNTSTRVNYRSLRLWQQDRNMDIYSLIVEPLFADPAAGDFHLRSEAGRFDPLLGDHTNDTVTSWAIDAGNPGNAFQLEPDPNGGRLNLGLYGNTPQASLTVTNPAQAAIKVVSLRNGGTIGQQHELYWLSRGLGEEETVRLEYSDNNGVNWYTITNNIPAWQQTFEWDFSEVESSPLGLWRISLESDTNITDRTPTTFTIRNHPISYFVNVTNEQNIGRVYTDAPGSSTNDGITASTPVACISTIIERYILDDGDIIYVDTGVYEIQDDITIQRDDSGVATNRVRVLGSPHPHGTVLDRGDPNTGILFDLYGAQHIEIRNFTITNANIGVFINNPSPAVGGNLLKNLLICDGGSAGVSVGANSSGNRLERVIITRHTGVGITHSSAISVDSSIIWSNQGHAINVSDGTLSISNSVLHARGDQNAIYNVGSGTVLSDYNALFADEFASYARKEGFVYGGLPQWSQFSGQDWRSVATDPLFYNPAEDDYHLLSVGGRLDPEDGWVEDEKTSLLIDLASPYSSWYLEPEPNGGRRNIGFYGGTDEASKSRGEPWVLAVTALQGGRMGGIIPLYWAYSEPLSDTTNRVRLEYSLEEGEEGTWELIADDVPINENGFLWDSTDPLLISPVAKWRVVLEADTNVYHASDFTFALNGPFIFYVNDDSTEDTTWCSGPGDDENLGISTNRPKATIRSVLNRWDLEPGDSIYVDTGYYTFDTTNFVRVTPEMRGAPGEPVTIRGSTRGDGTRLHAPEPVPDGGFFGILAAYCVVEDMQVQEGRMFASASNVVFRNMHFSETTVVLSGLDGRAENLLLEEGSLTLSGHDGRVSHVELRDAGLTVSGNRAQVEHSVVSRDNGVAVTISGSDTVMRNNTVVVVGTGRAAVNQTGGSLTLENNILVADGLNSFVIGQSGGTLESDYNLLLPRNGAWFGIAEDGLWERLYYWQERSGQDLNSISADPLFADENERDFRLQSVTGRWTPDGRVMDLHHSPAIDAGNPVSPFGNEGDPNGGRVNLGAYGNTPQASWSRIDPWLQAISFNDGGAVRDTVTLRWLVGGTGIGSTNTVTLQYSADGGANWDTIVSGLSATLGAYEWDTTPFASSFDARWRVLLDEDTNVSDEIDSAFSVRNHEQDFFVNDGETTDIYTTESGDPSFDGLTPETPKTSIQAILDAYDTVGGDVIYVDTGLYQGTGTRIIWSRGGDALYGPLTIQGSTNLAAGGTVLHRSPGTRSGQGLNVHASFVDLRDLTVRNFANGIYLNTNRHVTVERVFSYSNDVGVFVSNTRNATLRNLRVWDNESGGMDLSNARTTIVENVTFVGHSNFSYRARNTIINNTLQNNIFVVTENNGVALAGAGIVGGQSFIDYNIYHLKDGGGIYRDTLDQTNFFYHVDLRRWQLDRGHDFRSALTDPLLHDASAGNFHLQSEYGRYNPDSGTFVEDGDTSWAVGRGNPDSPFDQQPEPTAGRVNLGAFGNTEFASKGSTDPAVQVRTLNDGISITNVAEQVQPLVWAVNNVPEELWLTVQYSGDGGVTWSNLQTDLPAYQEYWIWNSEPHFNTYKGQWRIIGEHESVTYSATNAQPFEIEYGRFGGIDAHFLRSGKQTIRWRGAWDEDYRVEYTENGFNWTNAPTGSGDDQQAEFTSERGGNLYYEDVESTNDHIRFRSYRVWWDSAPEQEE